jgi:hypothetical protein
VLIEDASVSGDRPGPLAGMRLQPLLGNLGQEPLADVGVNHRLVHL